MKRFIFILSILLFSLFCFGQTEKISILIVIKGDTIENPNYNLKINDSLIFNQTVVLSMEDLLNLKTSFERITIDISFQNYTLYFSDVFLSGLVFIPADNVWCFSIYDINNTSECFGKELCASFFSKWGNAEYFYVY